MRSRFDSWRPGQFAVIAQSAERILGKDKATGSIPVNSTNADVAHQVEQQTENLCVVGSSPTVATIPQV